MLLDLTKKTDKRHSAALMYSQAKKEFLGDLNQT